MTKRDRAKLEKRMEESVLCSGRDRWTLLDFVASEVDRAVRAERKAFRACEKLREAALQRADERLVRRFK